ncbi:MAG: hypothetical protein CL405_04385 [Acidimicrobiaceae bacterium]|jgi:hypothetical protein|nr:hypothetical protein [Acidimicrobiaceae bacterium]MDP6482047.1 type II CAAX endopeptidase family protein [Acidimicrobiales bacterium]MDP6697833.1 type II CAAX endopeptidase family protein [Acidimicrobiales bacterium]|tara:strand:+ start:2708 stop:3418 length:711 start_codon:yes stop_codon:yes gene_type:complete
MIGADPQPTAEKRPWGLPHVVVGIFLSLFATAVFSVVVFAAGGYDSQADLPLSLVALLQVPLWTGLLGVPYRLVRRSGVSWATDLGFNFRRSDVLSGLALGVGAQAVLVPLLYAPILLLTDDLDVSEPARELVDKADGLGIVVLLLVVVVGAPVIEEIFFRGLVLRAFEDRWHPRVALVASSIVFGLIHFQPLQFPALVMFGLISGHLAQRHGRLGRAVWAHVGFNAWTVGMLLVL